MITCFDGDPSSAVHVCDAEMWVRSNGGLSVESKGGGQVIIDTMFDSAEEQAGKGVMKI